MTNGWAGVAEIGKEQGFVVLGCNGNPERPRVPEKGSHPIGNQPRLRREKEAKESMMKLFIWNDPYPVPYGSSMLFVVAENIEQAKELAATQANSYAFGMKQINVGNDRAITDKLGVPDVVADLPCAQFHEWSE